jgi:hypothetical protein
MSVMYEHSVVYEHSVMYVSVVYVSVMYVHSVVYEHSVMYVSVTYVHTCSCPIESEHPADREDARSQWHDVHTHIPPFP